MNIFYKACALIAIAISSLNAADNREVQPGSAPRISGQPVEWLQQKGDLSVKVVLNQTNETARKANEGKSQPVMLSEVVRIGQPDAHPLAVLLEEGSHIEFQVKAKGPCGFGYRISTGHEEIVKNLYRTDCEGKDDYLVVHARRYQAQEKTIVVDSFQTMGITRNEEKAKYMFCEIAAWKLEGFEKNGIQYPRRIKRESASVEADVKGGAVHQGEYSETRFGTISKVKDGEDIGSLSLQFYIFASQKARDQFYTSHTSLGLGNL